MIFEEDDVKSIVKQTFVFVFILVVCLSYVRPEALISKPEYKVKMKFGVMVPMRDGVKLATDIYFPDAEGKFPAILIRIPYNNSRPYYDRYGKFYAKRGYVLITQDCRGTYD